MMVLYVNINGIRKLITIETNRDDGRYYICNIYRYTEAYYNAD